MPHPMFAALLLIASATVAGTPVPTGQTSVEFAQTTVRGQIILRIPNMPLAAVAPPRSLSAIQPPHWVEKKGPKCVAADKLGGAIVNGNIIDLVMRGGDRIRAVIDGDCAALGSYGGFYFKPSPDGQMCAGRDSIRTRSGDVCTIRRFNKLVAKR